MNDRDAVAKLKQGDINGLEVLVRQYHIQAMQTAYLVVHDWALAEDIAQAAFVNAFERISSFDSSRPFKPWFLRSVLHSALKVSNSRHDFAPGDQNRTEDTDIVSPEPGLAEMLETKETREEILAALNELSPGQRTAVVMKYYLDLSNAEISKQLEVPEGTVRRRLHDARKSLRKLLPV